MDHQNPTQKLSFFSTSIPIILKTYNLYILSFFLFIVISITFPTILNPFGSQSLYPNHQQKGDENYRKTCDFSNGEWVWDETHPTSSYNENCRFLDPGFQCHQNGRANEGFRQWRWQPRDCYLPRGIYFQEGQIVNVTMHYMEAFRRSIRTWKSWAQQKLDPQTSHIFFRSYSPVHFRNGTWYTGGTCRESVSPEKNKTKLQADPLFNQYISEAVEEMKVSKMKAVFLNITYLSEFRSDGHPSIHREPIPSQPIIEDCSHWCLPGIPDTWNELLYGHLLMEDFRIRPK